MIDGVLYAVVDSLTKRGVHTDLWGSWRQEYVYELWIAANLQQSVAWKPLADQAVLVLR